MNIVKTFTEFGAVREALFRIMVYPFQERPILRVRYKIYNPIKPGKFSWELGDNIGVLLDVIEEHIVFSMEEYGLFYFNIRDMIILDVLMIGD